MQLEVSFNYDIGDRVKTPFNKDGIVRMASVDDGGKQYFVETESGGSWFKEKELTMDVEKLAGDLANNKQSYLTE